MSSLKIVGVLGLVLFQSFARAETEDQSIPPLFCEAHFLTEARGPAVDWRALDREERVAILVSQIVGLFAHGIVPSGATLRDLSEEVAARVGWSRKDLRLIDQRAYELYPLQSGSGLRRLIQMAGFRAKPPKPAPRVAPVPPPPAPPEPVPYDLPADVIDVPVEQIGLMSEADRLTLLRRQVKALVDANLLNSIHQLAGVTAGMLRVAGVDVSERSARTLERRADLLLARRRVGDTTVTGLTQLMLELGLPYEQIVRPDPATYVAPAKKAPAARVPAAWPKTWQEVRPVDLSRTVSQDYSPHALSVYRAECRAILGRLRELHLTADYTPDGLAESAERHEWAGTGLSANLVASLPARAAIGFHYMGDYLGLLKEFDVVLPEAARLAFTRTRRVDAAAYVPQPTAAPAVAPVLDRTAAPAATPEQIRLITVFHAMEARDLDTDVAAIRALTVAERRSLGLGDEYLEASIKANFKGGWRDWVERAGGDADEIVRLARRRTPGS